MSWDFKLDRVHNYAWQLNVFTEDECKKIIEIKKSIEKSKPITFAEHTVDYRLKTDIYWIQPNDTTAWIFKRLTDSILYLNDNFFKFNLFGFNSDLQLTHYHSKGAKYKKHIDRGLNTCVRKLTASIQLSESTSYKDCDLILYLDEKPTHVVRDIGSLTVYPSWVLHEVSELKKGERYSLVCWATGEQFI